MRKNTLVILAIVWMTVVIVVASSMITMSQMGAFSADGKPGAAGLIRVSEEEYDIISRYARLEEIRRLLKSRFYQELEDDSLVLGAIRGMLGATEDDYTFYYTPEERRKLAEHSQGVYEGVGLVLSSDREGRIAVLRVYPDTPAEMAGMTPGDRIVKIDGVLVSGATKKQMDDAVAQLGAEAGQILTLTVLRAGETLEVRLRKVTVNVRRTSHRMLDERIGYIAIYEFQGDDVTGFQKGLEELKRQGMQALVIDVRDNPGGLLSDVIAIADLLLPEGLLVYVEDRMGQRDPHYSDEAALNMPMAILVNGASASASEILAGALQDYKAGLVVGMTTYGKGIVQTVLPFPGDGAAMQMTTAKYYTPKGRSIHGIGITPDIEAELPEGVDWVDAELHPSQDVPLRRAVQALGQWLLRKPS